MYRFTIHTADRNIAFETLCPESERYCQKYLTDAPADWTLQITDEDLQKEKNELIRQNMYQEGMGNSYLEMLAMHRMASLKLLEDNVLLFHGSCIAVDGAAYMFMALSGTGKSTHSRLWREVLGNDHTVFMVNDDKPFIRVTDNDVIAYGSPWDGKHRLSTNTGVPLAGIAKLERSDHNCIEPMPDKKDLRDFFEGVLVPKDAVLRLKAFSLLDTILYRTPCYRLSCNMDPEAAIVSYRGMKSD
jgi:hypothetical protein